MVFTHPDTFLFNPRSTMRLRWLLLILFIGKEANRDEFIALGR